MQQTGCRYASSQHIIGFAYAEHVGFGAYLASVDPSREWREHLQYILIFCRVHVKRNLFKYKPKHPARAWCFHVLFSLQGRSEVRTQLSILLQQHPDLRNWLKPKDHPCMLCGISKAFSKIDPEWWDAAPKTSNCGESSHNEDYCHAGRKGSMLGASVTYISAIFVAYAKNVLTSDRLKEFSIQRNVDRKELTTRGTADTWRNNSSQRRMMAQVTRQSWCSVFALIISNVGHRKETSTTK